MMKGASISWVHPSCFLFFIFTGTSLMFVFCICHSVKVPSAFAPLGYFLLYLHTNRIVMDI